MESKSFDAPDLETEAGTKALITVDYSTEPPTLVIRTRGAMGAESVSRIPGDVAIALLG